MTNNHTNTLVGDPAREAVDALRGFDHQIWRTVLEWVRLPHDHALYVEGAEDLDRHTPGSAQAIQIKNASTPVTLRTVLDSIVDFWQHQRENSQEEIHFSYLATAGRGLEKDRPFGDVPGLDQWDRCRDGADLASLLSFLSQELASLVRPADRKNESRQNSKRREDRNAVVQDLLTFLEGASDDDVRARLIRRITWDTASPSQAEIEEQAKRALIAYGESLPHKHSPHESEQVLPHLIQHVWSVARSPAGERWLRRADWMRIFEGNTMLLVPRAVFQQVAKPGAAEPASAEQPSAQRRHDLDVLREFSRHVHWPTLRGFIENGPKRYHNDVLAFQAALGEFVAADFFLYTTDLEEQIRAMSDHWDNVLSIASNYVERTNSGLFVWPMIGDLAPRDPCEVEAWERASESMAALCDAREQVLARLRDEYREIDLKEGSNRLWRRMKDLETQFAATLDQETSAVVSNKTE